MVGRLALMLARPFRFVLGHSKVTCVHTFHGHVFSGYFSKGMTIIYKMIERLLWSATDIAVVLTPKLGSEIMDHLNVSPEGIRVIPLGLDLQPYLCVERKNIFNEDNFSPKYWLGWVGRMVDIKNPFRFIELAKRLKEKLGDDIGFVMVGDGILRADVENHLSQLGLRDSFVLTGWRSDLAEVYSGLDALVNTSDNEGTPVTLLEGMSSGLPVLGTDVGGTAEAIGCSPKGLSRAIHPEKFLDEAPDQILNWLASLSRLSEESREEIVERYSEERLYKKLLTVYQSK
jgi:glycosyltransferase involved in cell wall biosynthesis